MPGSPMKMGHSGAKMGTPPVRQQWAGHYAGDADRRSPLLSPVYADPARLRPLLVLAGEHEILRHDAERVAAAAARAGTQVQLSIGKGMQHDWPLTLPWLTESRRARAAMSDFVRDCTLALDPKVMRS